MGTRSGRPTANTKTNFNKNIYAEGKKDFVLGCAVRDFVIKAYLKKYFPDIDLGAFMSTIYACQFLCVKIYHLKLNLNESKSKSNNSESKPNALIVRVVDGGPKQGTGDLPVVDIQTPIFFTEGYNSLGHPTNKTIGDLTAKYQLLTITNQLLENFNPLIKKANQLLKNVKLKYDYKSASIPGYNPEYFINKGEPKLSSISYKGLEGITTETTEKNAAKSSNINNAPFIRFFIPSDEKDSANSLYKNKTGRELPDGLFEEGPSSIKTVEIEEPKIPESDGSVFGAVEYIMSIIRSLTPNEERYKLIKYPDLTRYPGFKLDNNLWPSVNCIDCSGFVWWTLCIAGIVVNHENKASTHKWRTYDEGTKTMERI